MDTRAITRYLRQKGACQAVLTTSHQPTEAFVAQLNQNSAIQAQDYTQQVTCSERYVWNVPPTTQYKVAVLDCGVKHNLLRLLQQHGCACTVLPNHTSAGTILQKNFHGLLLSNGPGDPATVGYVVETIRQLLGKLPIFGICLGHQLLGLAINAKTFKLKFGHHGANHPIQNLSTGKVEITTQNHNYALQAHSIDEAVATITHMNLNDGTVAGLRLKNTPAFSVQYHPEASPGPHDAAYLFQQFIDMMAQQKEKTKKLFSCDNR